MSFIEISGTIVTSFTKWLTLHVLPTDYSSFLTFSAMLDYSSLTGDVLLDCLLPAE